MTYNQTRFDGISAFVAVVEAGSFTLAAQRLGHSPSFVSKEIKALESRLGIRLLNRTTRSLSLTDAGQQYFHRCQELVSAADDAASAASDLGDTLTGTLKLSAPVGFGMGFLSGLLPDFLDRHPDLKLDLVFTDQMVDVVADGFDLVLRVGPMNDSSLVARQISTTRGLTVAAPAYLKANGNPEHPADLTGHTCISYSRLASPNRWVYQDQDGRPLTVDIAARIQCNSGELERSLAVTGMGITRLPAFACVDELRSGELVPLLQDFERPPMPIYAVYPHRQHLPQKVRAFVDYLVDALREDAWPGRGH